MIYPEKEMYGVLEPQPPEVRLTAEPLLALFKIEGSDNGVSSLAMRLGTERHSLYRWIENGIDLRNAERMAEKINTHPSLIWGPEYHIATYMEANRQKIMARRKREKLVIRRSIARKEKKNEAITQ
jgi:hypothetical protein